MKRRSILLAGSAAWLPVMAQSDVVALLRRGGLAVAMRHAQAPGTFDPPGFRLDDCSTQRNLSEDGRAQSRRIGAWFREQDLKPSRVRSSPWCRCLDTARLAFAGAEPWAALGSPRGAAETTNDASLAELRRELAAASRRAGFEVWVTHMFVIQALVGGSVASGEALLLRADAAGQPKVLARLAAG
jgi:phosphohistidine phosphatase SixA